jgi:hypothetical protein
MRKIDAVWTFSAKTRAECAGSPCRAELPECTAYDAECHLREPVGITRTMVTILRLREIESFGFRAATGPPAAGSGHCRPSLKLDLCVDRFPAHRDAEQTTLRQPSCDVFTVHRTTE